MQTPMHWKHNVIQITIARMLTINYITMIMDTSVTILTALRLTCAGTAYSTSIAATELELWHFHSHI